MAPSQLKQLKTSLRESGVVGQQQSKKQKKKNAKPGAQVNSRLQRNAALEGIRERFNPFEIKAPTRSAKFDVTTTKQNARPVSRPGVTRSMGEERRRETLLKEMQRRNKVGGVLDRRFGEDDPTMTPEERAAERFARESQKKFKKDSIFNLEDEDDEEFQLTHMGQSLSFDGKDDFQEKDLAEEEAYSDNEQIRKRKRLAEVDDMGGMASEEDEEEEEEQPERKKTKQEVMKELIAKSKAHKYERQKAKEDDDDLRAELDKGLPDLFELMRGTKKPEPKPKEDPAASMNPDRAALLSGKDREETDREYDQRVKQMLTDQRSQPADRTKTDEEKAEEEAERLKHLELERLRRMRGEDDLDEDMEEQQEVDEDDESMPDDAKMFGLSQPEDEFSGRSELGVEDEDDFIIDDDLVASDSEAELSLDDSDASQSDEEEEGEEDDEFINGLTLPPDVSANATTSDAKETTAVASDGVAFTYPCPETHEAFLEIIEDVPFESISTVVQRIRALHHPRLHSDNKNKLAQFSRVLVQHVSYMTNQEEHPPFAIIESLLRHAHSLAKSYPESVALEFRAQLRSISEERPLELLPGDLVILHGIAAVFPTSDHFHAVVTPAMLSLTRYLGQSTVTSLADLATGAYCASLCLQYQAFAKRHIPEFMNYVLNALCALAPVEPKSSLGFFPVRKPTEPLRLGDSKKIKLRKPRFWDVCDDEELSADAQEELKATLLATFVSLLDKASESWMAKSAFEEIFAPARKVLRHLVKTSAQKLPVQARDLLQSTADKLHRLSNLAHLGRRPLLLHSHRPLAIKMSIPKFEENFNPDRHYDPDRERAEINKLKAEHKKERKGAMRELRKDANFIARESLREKKEKDAAYEKKYKKLVADIQGEEAREGKVYEREKRARQSKK